MKVLTHPVTGPQVKLGRKEPTAPHGRVMMKELLDQKVLPQVTVPATTNYSTKAASSLHKIYKNDVWGCCVIAGGFHVRGVTSGNSGSVQLFTDAQVQQDYSAIGGFDPSQTQPDGSNPTDQGCDENTALTYREKTGFPDGVKLVNAIASKSRRDIHISQIQAWHERPPS